MRIKALIVTLPALCSALLACDSTEPDEMLRRGGIQSGAVEGEGPAVGRRWVLRDAEGAAVNAVVEPSCRAAGPACAIDDVGATGGITPECARVLWLGDQYVNLKYNLISGRAEDCTRHWAAIADFGESFADAECAGPFFTTFEEGTESAYRFTRSAAYIEETATLYTQGNQSVTQDIWYVGPDCEPFELPPEFSTMAPWVPVPAWALDALSTPPYALHWE